MPVKALCALVRNIYAKAGQARIYGSTCKTSRPLWIHRAITVSRQIKSIIEGVIEL
jgi:hypothetical protein